MQFRLRKKALISSASALLAAILLLGMEASSAPASNVTESTTGITLNQAQRQAVAATTGKHATSARRDKQARAPRAAAVASLSATQLQRALSASNKPRDRQRDKLALIDDTQQHALRTLNAVTQDQGGVQAHFNARNGTLSFLKPRSKTLSVNTRALSATGKSTPSMVAKQFLTDQRALFKLDDPQTETRVTRQSSDTAGRSHVRLQQVYQGVPLWGKELLVHTQGANGVYLVQGSYEATPRHLGTTPAISAEQALSTVRANLGAQTNTLASSTLVIYTPEKGGSLLAYKVEITSAPDARWIYFINARNGKIVHRIKNIHTNVVNASGTDLRGVTRNFNAWSPQAGQFYLIDPSTPTPDAVPNPITNGPNPLGDTFILNAHNGDGTSLIHNISTAKNSGWDPRAVSAAYNTRVVYDYFKNTFNRNSLDDRGMNLMVVTRFQSNYNNAFWNGTFMVYGDGDGQLFNPLAGCLDVAAHEMSHGVIEHSANLIYENQSGALNESFADIFGAMVDGDDWLLGEDCTVAAPGFLRNMKNPSQGLSPQPSKMSEYQNLPNTDQGDNGGVHVNSGIPNRAAYLIAEGLSAEGLGTSIGRAKTGRIFYDVLTLYLTASAQFVDARRATIQAATALHGENSTEVQAVTAAWNAVEVMDNISAPPPTSTDPVPGDDVMVYLYPRDHVFTDASEPFDLYMQIMDRPFTAYNPAKDILLNNSIAVAYTRPVVYTDKDGTWVLYVGVDNNLYRNAPDNTNTALTTTGNIYSIAASPDGRYFAYTLNDKNDNTIYVLDRVAASPRSFPITPSNYQQGSGGADSIFYADALSFDYSGRHIIFDVLNCISTPGDACNVNTGTGYQYWSIGQLNVTNGQLFFPFPSQNPAIDLGYPSFAANNQSVIALDYQNWTGGSGSIKSSIVTINFETQALNTIYTFSDTTAPHFGIPSFWGDDDYLTFQIPDATSGRTAIRIALNGDWSKSGSPPQSINPAAVLMPVMHRAGQRVLTGGLSTSATLLDFGQVAAGQSKSLQLTLTNNGNNDVNITNVSLADGAFQADATNTRVPRGKSLSITVSFAPGAIAGTQTSTLTFFSDGNPSSVSVSLAGAALPPPSTPPPPSSPPSGGGGGGALDPWFILLLAGAFHLARRMRKKARPIRLVNRRIYWGFLTNIPSPSTKTIITTTGRLPIRT